MQNILCGSRIMSILLTANERTDSHSDYSIDQRVVSGGSRGGSGGSLEPPLPPAPPPPRFSSPKPLAHGELL